MASRIARIVLAVLVLAFAIHYFRAIDWHDVWSSARGASLPLLALAALCNAPLVWLKALRLQRLLPAAVSSLSHRQLMKLYLASYAADNLFMSQAGPAVRAGVLAKHGLPLSSGLSLQVLEKVLEAIALGLVVAPLALFSPETPLALRLVHAGFILALVTLLVAAVWLGRVARAPAPRDDEESPRLLGRIERVASPLLSRSTLLAVLLQSALVWLIEIAMVAIVLRALAIDVPLTPASALVVLGVNFAALVPGLPANLGPFEAACVVALGVFSVAHAPALGFALLYHLLHTLPVTLIGLPSLRAAQPSLR